MGNVPFQNPFAMQFGSQPQIGISPQLQNALQMQASMQQQQQQTPSLLGRFVTSADDITPQEVSMSSTPSLFPLADGSAIIAKQWANDGTIKTVRYSAEVKREEEASSVSLLDVMQQLDDMQDMMDAMKKALEKKPTTSTASKRTTKKEADDAEA